MWYENHVEHQCTSINTNNINKTWTHDNTNRRLDEEIVAYIPTIFQMDFGTLWYICCFSLYYIYSTTDVLIVWYPFFADTSIITIECSTFL